MEKRMMIDFKREDGTMIRREIDNMEFYTKNGAAFFSSDGRDYEVALVDIIQIYTY